VAAAAPLLVGPPGCTTPEPLAPPPAAAVSGAPDPADCSLAATTPRPEYLPGELFTIPVVVHVILDSACSQGAMTDQQVADQIAVLNQDFQALPGSNGELGTDTRIRFVLATTDPQGNPTTGITRDCNTTWFNDGGAYFETLAWDPHRYLNLYSNSASGARGYVPFLPATDGGARVGGNDDRVVINHLAFGVGGPVPAHTLGRTATHEVGHYLGLYHPYFEGCGVATAPDCYQTGDRLCDTPPDAAAHDVCPIGATSCGGVEAPIHNYMELTDDPCLTEFTPEQAQRLRCTLIHYRPQLFIAGELFADGFESGNTSAWSAASPLAVTGNPALPDA
jgi:hypothetical protein